MSRDWRDRALCREVDPELMAPEVNTGEPVRTAQAICARCKVRTECLEDALALEAGQPAQMRATVRGGLTPRQRHAIHRKRQQQAA